MYCRDLLGKDIKKKLDLKEHPDRGVYVSDITLHPVHNTQVGSLCTSPALTRYAYITNISMLVV